MTEAVVSRRLGEVEGIGGESSASGAGVGGDRVGE